MARLCVFLWLIIVAGSFSVIQTMAETESHDELVDNQTEGSITTTSEAHGPAVSRGDTSDDEHHDAESPSNRRLGPNHHSDKSVAGGGVIIGGLVTAILAAVVCYIRVTRKRNSVL